MNYTDKTFRDSVVLEVSKIQQALSNSLPGWMAQKKMSPRLPSGNLDRDAKPDTDSYREAAVMLLLYWYKNGHPKSEPHLILTRRSEYPGVHSGQISFPGGQREGNETLTKTALRETEEEIGVPPTRLEVIGRLSPLYLGVSGFYIHPFVAYSPKRPKFRRDPKEVAELVESPLSLLLDPTNHKEEKRYLGYAGPRLIPYFDVFGHRVWGATAMILSEFLSLFTNQTGLIN